MLLRLMRDMAGLERLHGSSPKGSHNQGMADQGDYGTAPVIYGNVPFANTCHVSDMCYHRACMTITSFVTPQLQSTSSCPFSASMGESFRFCPSEERQEGQGGCRVSAALTKLFIAGGQTRGLTDIRGKHMLLLSYAAPQRDTLIDWLQHTRREQAPFSDSHFFKVPTYAQHPESVQLSHLAPRHTSVYLQAQL